MARRYLAVLMVLLTALCPAWAQQGLSINDLSTRARLHEDGQAYTVEVRFTTPIPAVASGSFGEDPSCPQALSAEAEPFRNHRFDIRDVPIDEHRFVRVSVAAEGEEVASDLVEVAPPPPFPRGAVERVEVPLTVVESAGVARDEPVVFGIPLPEGALGVASAATLSDGGRPVPIATRALVRWPDGTIKWLLVEGRVRLQPNESKTLTLALGTGVQPVTPDRRVLVRQDGDAIEIDTGAARLSIDRSSGEGTIAGPDGELCPLPVSRLTAVDGTVYLGRAERVTVEEQSARSAVILVEGHHVNAVGAPYFGYALRYFLNADDAFVRVDHVLRHDVVSADMDYGDEMKSFASLDLIFPIEADEATLALEDGQTATIRAGERLFQHFDDKYELGEASGGRAPGLVSMGGLTVATRDFWQNWPKSLEAERGALVVGLYPAITPADRYANRPDEHILYYYLRDGNYTFRAGLEKRHELLIGPTAAATAEQIIARVNEPLVVSAPVEWYTSSGALGNIVGGEGREFTAYDRQLSDVLDAHLRVREQQHWYGLMNFGDWWGERGNNWGNIEYDLQHALFTQYFRTADPRFFRAAETSARHNADIDVVHYAAGQRAGPGGPRRVGQAWVHCMGHTGGYYPYDYMGMSIYAQGYSENRGHMWNQGNLEYWLLTGDEQVHHSAMQLADWVAGPNITDFRYGNARVPGWMGIVAMSTYFATYDEYYLNAMRMMYREVQKRADPDAGLWVRELSGGHCGCTPHHHGEAGFMAGVLMTALKYYYMATGDPEVAERIVKIANFCVDTMYESRQHCFRYTSCPKTGCSSSAAMIMGNGLAFAANYSGDQRLMEITRDQFVRGFMAFAGGAQGKTIGYATCAAPMAIHEIAKFPGPTLDEMFTEMMEVARDPARRPLPGIVPNPDFEEGLGGWTVRSGLSLSRSRDVVHTGSGAAMASGEIQNQNEYFVTRYSCGLPWEIMSLQPGESYRVQLWLRVDEIGEGVPAPNARVSVRSKGVTRQSFQTNAYDLTRPGTWQLLQGEFTVPEGTDAAYIAVNTGTKDAQTVRMYLDDVSIVAADTPERDTYLYPSAVADDARPAGGVTLTDEGIIDGWDVLASTDGVAGSAELTVDVPIADTFRLMLRVKSPKASGSVRVAVDGGPARNVAVGQDERWTWVAVPDGDQPAELTLAPGKHTVTVIWPEGSGVMLQKVALSNEFPPQ